MNFKPRVLAKTIKKAVQTFPAVVLTGPRQSGKTTLFKALFAKTHAFASLEDLDIRMRAKEDPVGFLAQYKPPLVIDEIQYVPELLSYVKTRIDEKRRAGQWLFTGSQNFTLMQGVSQSLAGRAAILSLLPFSFCEILNNANNAQGVSKLVKNLNIHRTYPTKTSLADLILRGNYPELVVRKKVDRQLWCGSYISTYLERDVRNLTQVGDLNQFERFLRLCATRTGQILNLSEMAKEIGISVPTAKRWLSILETGYQIYLLYPYYRNLGKRWVKSPKLYFIDTALAAYLLGLQTKEMLFGSLYSGSLFETMIVTDFLKRFLHFGQMPSMYYLRTQDGLEIDLVLEIGQELYLFEIKNTMTVTSKHSSSLRRTVADLKSKVKAAVVISNSDFNCLLQGSIPSYGWKNILAC